MRCEGNEGDEKGEGRRTALWCGYCLSDFCLKGGALAIGLSQRC